MKKIGLICLAVVLALGVLGIGFAHWSQTLFINGTVDTGTFCVGFSEQIDTDDWVELCNPGAIDDPDRIDFGYTKNVAACHSELVDKKGMHGDEPVYERMLITVCNAYPSYTNIIEFSLDNCGTIPAIVQSAEIVSLGGVPLAVPIPLPKNDPINVDLDGDGQCDVDITFSYDFATQPADQQIDPCESLWYDLTLHFKDGPDGGLKQGLTGANALSFEIEIETIQWNKA